MGERDKSAGFGLARIPTRRSTAARQRKLRVLKRIGDALDQPVHDFFGASAGPDAPDTPSDRDDPERGH